MANLSTEVHGLIMVSAVVNGIACPFLIDTGADVSLLPLAVVQRHALPIRRHVARQPVMVDGSTFRCDGIVSTAVQLGSRSAQLGVFLCCSGTVIRNSRNELVFVSSTDRCCQAEASGRG